MMLQGCYCAYQHRISSLIVLTLRCRLMLNLIDSLHHVFMYDTQKALTANSWCVS